MNSIQLGGGPASDTEEEDCADGEWQNVGVSAARTQARARNKGPGSHPILNNPRILKRKEQESKLPSTRTLRSGDYIRAAVEDKAEDDIPPRDREVRFASEIPESQGARSDTVMNNTPQ